MAFDFAGQIQSLGSHEVLQAGGVVRAVSYDYPSRNTPCPFPLLSPSSLWRRRKWPQHDQTSSSAPDAENLWVRMSRLWNRGLKCLRWQSLQVKGIFWHTRGNGFKSGRRRGLEGPVQHRNSQIKEIIWFLRDNGQGMEDDRGNPITQLRWAQ